MGRVAIVHPGGADMAAAVMGIWSYATAAPLNPDHTVGEFAVYLQDLRVKAQNPQITQDSDTPEVVLEEALQLRKGVEELEAWASQAQSFQTIFGGDMDICGIDCTRGCRH